MMKVLIQNNPKYILYLWGIDGTSKEVVLKKIKNNGLEKNIKYMGTTDKINEYINAMDLMLLPSMFEGFPVTVVEWQANGLPCILSDTITPDCNLMVMLSFFRLTMVLNVGLNKLKAVRLM